jgi:hypothetical protein
MFFLLRLIIWLSGLAVVCYGALRLVGYDVNWAYFQDQRPACEERLKKCRDDLIKSGIEGAKEKCDFQCVDPQLLIRKSVASESATKAGE